MSAIEAYYSANGKFYRSPKGTVHPSLGMVCSEITKEDFSYVGLESLERAILLGEGAHDVCCQYSLHVLNHLKEVVLPPMPAGFPGEVTSWNLAMAHSLTQVIDLFQQYEIEPVAVEETALCSQYGFGGQPDFLCRLKWKGRRILAVVDYKRVAKLSKSHQLKLEGYRMLDSFSDTKAGFIAWLKRDGPAQLHQVIPNGADKAAICGMAGVLNWRISNRILVP